MIQITVTDHSSATILAHASGPDQQARDLVLFAVDDWMINLAKREHPVSSVFELRIVGKAWSS